TRLLTTSKVSELDALSPECEQRVGMTLAVFAAEVHWQVALARTRSGPIRLTGVTPYEAAAMAARLIREYDAALRRDIQVRAPEDRKPKKTRPAVAGASSRPAADPASTRPARVDPAIELSSRLTIANWLDRPNELEASSFEAKALTEAIV